MKKNLFLVISAVIFCLAFSHVVRAQSVHSYADMTYYPYTNEMIGYTETSTDYGTQIYYCPEVIGALYNVTASTGDVRVPDYPIQCSGIYQETHARAHPTLPYDPNADYDVEANSSSRPYFVSEDGYYIDYNRLIAYMSGEPIFYPLYYSFIGNGPEERISFSSIALGVISAFQQAGAGAVSGPPHHLRVDYDFIGSGDCGQAGRATRYQVLDYLNRRVGKTYIKEVFPSSYLTDSCSGQRIEPSGCSRNYTDGRGIFLDILVTGCPSAGGSCGFTVDPNRFVWCQPGEVNKNLAVLYDDVRYSYVSINGNSSPYNEGTLFYPPW